MIVLNGNGVDKRFLMRLNLQQFADPAGGNDGSDGAGNDLGGSGGDGAGGSNGDGGDGGKDSELASQLEQLKAEMAKQKAALDKAASEASSYKKALKEKEAELKTKMTAEEIAAREKEEAEQKQAERLQELEREVAKAKSTKSVMANLSLDEKTSEKIAESMAGCENIDNALLLIKQAWDAKEKALRQEFGKIPPPGAGGAGGEDDEIKAAIELGKRFGKERAESNKSTQEGLQGYLR